LLGPGRNGKSTLLRIIQALLGKEHVSSVPLQGFGEDRFATAEVYGKLANICGDLSKRAIDRSDSFKRLTGQDTLYAQRKNQHPFYFVSYALPTFSANEAPHSKDSSYGYIVRWLIIPMLNVFVEKKADPDLTEKLTTAAELEGLLVLAVQHLRRLMRRKGFDPPAVVQKAGDDYREQIDSVAGWLADEGDRSDPRTITPRPELYLAYSQWCAVSGRRVPLVAGEFYAGLRQHGLLDGSKHGGVRGFRGLRLRGRGAGG
jgi:putative DNA primase/helicase